METNHEGYAGRASTQLRIPQSSTEAMAALGELFAGTMQSDDVDQDEDRCEALMEELRATPKAYNSTR